MTGISNNHQIQIADGPLISVITVCLNAAEFIEQTIQSVLSQTYPHIEYIVIDGASTDGTVDIIRKYESRLAYWHSKPDRGLSHAFNLGLAQAHGDWILYLNADDFFLEPTTVGKMVPYLISNSNQDVVFGQVFFMTLSRNPKPAPLRRIFGEPWNWQKFRFKDTIPHQASFINRRYFVRVGVFEEDFRIAMDYELFLRGARELKAHYVPLAVSGMRLGGSSGKNLLRTLRESRLAQEKNSSLPRLVAWLNCLWLLAYRCLGQLAFKILGPIAINIPWPGRCSGTILTNYKSNWPSR